MPTPAATLHRLAIFSGWRLHDDPGAPRDAVIIWQDATRRDDGRIAKLLITRHRAINGACVDISKAKVNEVFDSTFGYTLGIDPVTHVGSAVQKSDENARHDGVIVSCPLVAPVPDMAYQRPIDNRGDGGYIVWRVPIVGRRIPYALYNLKTAHHRFASGTFACRRVELVDTHEAFANDEVSSMLRFARRLGMDYGELDVLRDHRDGRIFVVDANSTPHGPPAAVTDGHDARAAHERLSHAFAAEFLPQAVNLHAARTGARLLEMR